LGINEETSEITPLGCEIRGLYKVLRILLSAMKRGPGNKPNAALCQQTALARVLMQPETPRLPRLLRIAHINLRADSPGNSIRRLFHFFQVCVKTPADFAFVGFDFNHIV